MLGRLSELLRHKSARPGVQLGLLGCVATHQRERLLDRAPYLDVIVGPDGYRDLPDLLRQADDPQLELRLDRGETYAGLAPDLAPGPRAFLTVMRGCDKFCTFCVVPFTRGRERSVPARRGARAGRGRGRGGQARGGVPRSDRERLPRRRRRLRRAAAARGASRRARADPLHLAAPVRRQRRADRGPRRGAEGDAVPAPAAAVRVRPRARGDAARLHHRATIARCSSACAPRCPASPSRPI